MNSNAARTIRALLAEYNVTGMGLDPFATIHTQGIGSPDRHVIELSDSPMPKFMHCSSVVGYPVNIPTLGFQPESMDFVFTQPKRLGEDAIKTWRRIIWTMKPCAWIFVNVLDGVEDGKRVPITAWHKGTLGALGIEWLDGADGECVVGTRRMNGKGSEVMYEVVLVGRKKVE